MCIQPSINNEEATVSFTITAVTTNIAVSMLLATNCCTNKKKKPNQVSEAQSNCLCSSSHLSLFISPFSLLLIHQAIIISLSLQSHPSLSQSLMPSPCLYSVSTPPPPVIPSAFLASVCLSLWCFSLLNTVASRLLSPSVLFFFFFPGCNCCVPRHCFNVTQLALGHIGYCCSLLERRMSACMRYVDSQWASNVRPISIMGRIVKSS